MLMPDQIRLRLERLMEQGDACNGCLALIGVLHAVLPELVAQPAPTQQAYDSRRCPDCTPEQPCDRVRQMMGRLT